jgi:endonuclease/exonuclease/phosphatase family metal-dependent hydrolase
VSRRGLLGVIAACTQAPAPEPEPEPPAAIEVRVATFNTSLFQELPGRLADRLSDPAWAPGRAVAAILQQVRPDIVLLNEVDTDLSGAVADRLRQNFLAVGQGGREPLDYPHAFVAAVNTGVATGFDLNRDGRVTTAPGSAAYANDAHGYGTFEGQYGMLVLSRYPIAASRTFQNFRWADLAEPGWPDDPETGAAGGWYADEIKAILRLSSKSHWDLTLDVGGHPLHLLASHPTPPAFDGPERRNVHRNNAEIRFWVDYLTDGSGTTFVDDRGATGGLGPGRFVIVGDLNADPNDGAVAGGDIARLLAHPRVHKGPAPASRGAVEAAERQGGVNAEHRGDPAHDTADWNPRTVGNLRVDYALPSADTQVRSSGVFWPASDEPEAALLGGSDHHLVWVDLRLE